MLQWSGFESSPVCALSADLQPVSPILHMKHRHETKECIAPPPIYSVMKHRALLFRISTASPTKSYDFDNNVAIILAAYGVVLDTPVAWKNSTPTIHASTARPTNVQNSDCMSRSLCTGQTAFVLTRVVYRQNLPVVTRPLSTDLYQTRQAVPQETAIDMF